MNQIAEADQSTPTTAAGAWGLRYPGLVMSTDGTNEVKEFTGMWALKPDADLVRFTKVLSPGGWPLSLSTNWAFRKLYSPLPREPTAPK